MTCSDRLALVLGIGRPFLSFRSAEGGEKSAIRRVAFSADSSVPPLAGVGMTNT